MPHLFSPLRLGSAEFKNRLWVAPMCQYSCEDRTGTPGEWHQRHYGTLAVGGFGLIITEATAVTPEGRISPQDAGLWNEAQRRAWEPVLAAIHRAGSVAAIQLAHAGRKASTLRPWERRGGSFGGGGSVPGDDGGWQTVAPSPLGYPRYAEPRELSAKEVGQVVRDFRDAAVRAVDAGFDAVEIHAAHGYLLHQFLSPLANMRQDAWGGGLEGRAKLLLEVVGACRAAVDVPLLVRVSATDWLPGGLEVEDFELVGSWLREVGADLIDVSSGALLPAKDPVGPAYQVPLATHIRRAAGIPVSAVGCIDSARLAEAIVAEGRADAVLVGRPALRNPHLALNWSVELGARAPWPVQYERAIP